MNLNRINLAAMWVVVTTTAGVMLWMFTNLAWSADIERIEGNQFRSEIRDQCYKWATAPDDVKDMVGRFVMDAKRDLCRLDSTDDRCDKATPEEVCK